MQGRSAPLRFGNYEPLLQLAAGGMATVHIARQLGAAGFERIVVVKRVHRHLLSDRGFYDMFRDEAHVASMVRHPNVVPVIDVVEIGDAAQDNRELLLVMEYVESCSLSTIQKVVHDEGKRIPVPIVARILCDALAGMHAAHTALDMRGAPLGVVHRDVSPQNIIVGVDGSARLIDFGVAKAAHRLSETRSGSVKGKYSYMAPEQAHGRPVDPRTDIFAAGIVFHECLTAKRLFRGENELDTVRMISEGEVPAPSSLEPAIPAELDAVALKALTRAPAGRFQTAIEMIDAIESAMPLASPREVAAYLERICGPRLLERREAIQTKLEAHPSAQPPTYDVDAPTERDSTKSDSMMDATRREGSGTEGRIAVETSPAREPVRSRFPTLVIVIAAVVAVGALVTALSVQRSRSASGKDQPTQGVASAASVASIAVLAPPASVAKAAPASSMGASTPVPPATKDIVVDLTAASTIERVDAAGATAIELSGKTARLHIPPWTGTLTVEATLQGGKKATAQLAAGTTTATLGAAKPHAPAGAGPAAPTPKPDLQGNPYGTQ